MVVPTTGIDSAGVSGAAGRGTMSRPATLRSLLLLIGAAAALGAAQIGDPDAALAADPELAVLLRAMASLKAIMIAAAMGVLLWRFQWPLSPRLGWAYLLGTATAVAACPLIWNLEYIVQGAALFHAGALALIVASFVDGAGTVGRNGPAR